MRIYLTGATGGIGSAIKESLSDHEFVKLPQYNEKVQDVDWLIFAHGVIDEDKIENTIGVNIGFPVSVTQQWISNIKAGVIYISSASGIRGNTKFPVYSASKAALNSYTETMSRAHPELQFYAICPGPTDTKMWRGLGLPGKAQEPSKVADAVKMAIEGKFLSGSIVVVRDGVVTT